jgi:hypothetical protein
MALERLILKELSEGQTESQVVDASVSRSVRCGGILKGQLPTIARHGKN